MKLRVPEGCHAVSHAARAIEIAEDGSVEVEDDARNVLMGTSKNIPLWCDDRRSSSQRGRSFNPWPLIEAA